MDIFDCDNINIVIASINSKIALFAYFITDANPSLQLHDQSSFPGLSTDELHPSLDPSANELHPPLGPSADEVDPHLLVQEGVSQINTLNNSYIFPIVSPYTCTL